MNNTSSGMGVDGDKPLWRQVGMRMNAAGIDGYGDELLSSCSQVLSRGTTMCLYTFWETQPCVKHGFCF